MNKRDKKLVKVSFKKKIKYFFSEIKLFIIEEYKFLIACLLILILFYCPVNYYIIIGGGISDVGKRIEVDDEYSSEGSFNMSYVSQLVGTLGPYLLSYVIPTWDRESVDLYKYDVDEEVQDVELRSDLNLLSANSNAIYWAYTLANKECEIVKTNIYVLSVISEFDSQFKVGDILLEIDNNKYNTLSEYQKYIQTLNAGDVIKVKVLRDNKEKTFDVELHKDGDRVVMGVYLQLINEYKTDPEVKFNFESDESGPSAGLVTTLALYDKLTEGDLTNSLKIAGTGTLEADGTVGEIGGVKYKLLGAEAGDADVFLVPSGTNYEECVKIKKEKKLKIKLIEVSTIEDAIEKLESLK